MKTYMAITANHIITSISPPSVIKFPCFSYHRGNLAKNYISQLPYSWVWPCDKVQAKGMWRDVKIATLGRNAYVFPFPGPLYSLLLTEQNNCTDIEDKCWWHWVIPPCLTIYLYPAPQEKWILILFKLLHSGVVLLQ